MGATAGAQGVQRYAGGRAPRQAKAAAALTVPRYSSRWGEPAPTPYKGDAMGVLRSQHPRLRAKENHPSQPTPGPQSAASWLSPRCLTS